MQTNFFSQLNAIQFEGDLTIIIKGGKHQHLLVSVLLNNENITDKAAKLIPPLILKGTTQEMDEGFFSAIKAPVQKTAALFVNMEAYEKAQELAEQESKMNREKENKEKTEKDEKKKKFESAMKKVKELEDAGKFREAYAQLPKSEDHPDHAKNLEEKRKKLAEKFDQPGLF